MKIKDSQEIRIVHGDSARETSARQPARTEKVSSEAAEVASSVADAKHAATAQRSARLADIEARVANGSYRPDPSRIAQDILASAELQASLRALVGG